MRVALLGLGLIGGSIARAVHGPGRQVAAWTPSGAAPRAALAEGTIDEAAATAGEAIAGADLVVLAAPPGACLDLLDALGGQLRGALSPGSVVTDVASTKVLLAGRARDRGLRFVGGHPMAGREASGYIASDPALFRGRPWVVVPPDEGDDGAVAAVEALAVSCGAVPFLMTAAEHDLAVAAISHAPLVVAVALVEAMAGMHGDPAPSGWPAALGLAAGGWASMTRLARGDASMGAGIARTNAGPLAARLRDVRGRLDEWLELLEASGPDGLPAEDALRARFAAARARLEESG